MSKEFQAEEKEVTLQELLVVSDKMPNDFAKNTKYKQDIEKATEIAKSFVYSLDDEGLKLAKSDVAYIRRYSKTVNTWVFDVYNKWVEKASIWKKDLTASTKELDAEAANILVRFDALKKEKLDDVRKKIELEIMAQSESNPDLRLEFVSKYNIEPFIRISSLTATGAVTKAIKDQIKALFDADLKRQQLHDNRILQIKVKCHENDVKTPFDKNYLGESFYGTNEEFDLKLNLLITNEVERVKKDRERIEAELTKKHEAEIQRKVDEQVKAEVAKKTDELRAIGTKLQPEVTKPSISVPPTPTPGDLHNRARHLSEMLLHCDNYAESNKLSAEASKLKAQANELTKNLAGKKKVVEVTVTFKNNDIRKIFSQSLNQAINDSFSVVTLTFSVDAFKPNEQIIQKFELLFTGNLDFIRVTARDV